MKIGGRLDRDIDFEAANFLLLKTFRKLRISSYIVKVPQEVAMLFRVAGVALCDMPCVSEGMCVQDRRGREVAVSIREAAETCPEGL